MSSEAKNHLKLKRKIKSILERCGFKVFHEVHIDIDNDGKAERSFDVCGIHGNTMLIVECKDVSKIHGIKKEISSWKHDLEDILEKKETLEIVSNHVGFDKTVFKKLEHIKLAFAVTDRIDNEYDLANELGKAGFLFWNEMAVKYYDKTSSTLGEWTKYEILRELDIFEESRDSHVEDAIKIEQANGLEMFLLGIHPGLLLRIGYVLRRTSGRPDAYQRVVSKERIEEISEFLKGSSVLVPNCIIIAFDPDVRGKIKYEKKNRQLTFPVSYCSAWVIDGQHRLYGFSKTDYRNWSPDVDQEFKLPVVAFLNLTEPMQNTTFVNINYYQKKIDSTLLCDLAGSTNDLANELTWPSRLVRRLNETEPWQDRIKVSEFHTGRSVTLSGFARYSLLERLLGYRKSTGRYHGPLFEYAPFDVSKHIDEQSNKTAFDKQFELLQRFFLAIRKSVASEDLKKDQWLNYKDYSLTKTTGVNAMLLVLYKIMEQRPRVNFDLEEYMKPIGELSFPRDDTSQIGGWKGFNVLADRMISKLNEKNTIIRI